MKRGRSSGPVLPKFFKVYIPGETGDDLELPTFCNTSFQRSLPRTVTVRSIYGKNWKLVLRRCEVDGVERFSLVDGWKRIAADEGLNERDFLAFEFDGSRCFNFCIFDGRTMCKRTRSSSTGNDQVKSESDDVVDLTDFVSDADDVEDVDTDDDHDHETDDGDHKKFLDDPKSPSFKMNLNPNKKSQLRIPSWIVNDYNLNFPESVTIVDPLEDDYGTLERNINSQGRGGIFVKKFGSVFRRNNVKESDTMIFELKKTGNNLVHTIKVHIIKA